ncbi:unnamed protein product [marine sediment metagenome]|uniref:Uncharacterized protein n=1 Tax=marine sediment metagenome TaxID=412755 RepID=X1CT93_9ZZZZ
MFFDKRVTQNLGFCSISYFRDCKIGIEVKKTREGLKEKQIADQIIIDIERYKASHADCKTLFCFVYDPEKLIQNPTGVEEDINKRHKGFAEVLICPKGL